nr:2184_t:CDS:2 [Entrophospora candida]
MIVENTIEKFLLEASLEAITPTTVIFQTIHGNGQILKLYKELEPAIRRGINTSIAKLDDGFQWNPCIRTIYKVSHESISSYALEVGIELLLMANYNSEIVDKNLKELKKKLASPISDKDTELCDALLEEPLKCMTPNLPSEIVTKCVKFVNEYKNQYDDKPENSRLNLIHDASWKDGISRQKKVVNNILAIINETWSNLVFLEAEFHNYNKMNEGTYVADVILPLI